MIFHLIATLFLALLYKIGLIKTKQFKERFFSFLKYFKNPDEIIKKFTSREFKKSNLQISDNDVVCSASPEFLVIPMMKRINPNARIIATKMNKRTGKIDGENCKGTEKANRLTAMGCTKFNNAYSDSLSDLPMMDLAERKYLVYGNKVNEFGKQKPPLFVKLRYMIKMLRVKHYIKNSLIFLPLFFGSLFFELNSLLTSIYGFAAFCCMSSAVYIINDLMDVKQDRSHTKKRTRPIASYMVKPVEALTAAIVLFTGAVLISLYLCNGPLLALTVLLGYFTLNFLYSVNLKRIPIVDVFTLAMCYMARLFYGGIIISVPISNLLYLTVLCAALYMGLGKRRNEMRTQKSETRTVNKLYNDSFLDKNMYVFLTLTMIFYSLWAIQLRNTVVDSVNAILVLFTIPVVFLILMVYSLATEKTDNSGDPIDVLLCNPVLIVAGVIFIALIVLAVYADFSKISIFSSLYS